MECSWLWLNLIQEFSEPTVLLNIIFFLQLTMPFSWEDVTKIICCFNCASIQTACFMVDCILIVCQWIPCSPLCYAPNDENAWEQSTSFMGITQVHLSSLVWQVQTCLQCYLLWELKIHNIVFPCLYKIPIFILPFLFLPWLFVCMICLVWSCHVSNTFFELRW